ncbi:hypothetical protein NPIL_88811 [Nephila pilipes]|uniref:Uncharacterized protein n=1 Tax=Nephila pilipes TaxID=299642 RepID=A0A8X6TCX1_NEPPI|nr:hypothetical protein NPIL_88811 [Nephila pilipes]
MRDHLSLIIRQVSINPTDLSDKAFPNEFLVASQATPRVSWTPLSILHVFPAASPHCSAPALSPRSQRQLIFLCDFFLSKEK